MNEDQSPAENFAEQTDPIPELIRGEFETAEPVDLVFYTSDGERIVLGKAGIDADGRMSAKIDQDVPEGVKQMLSVVKGEFSFGLPRQQVRPYLRAALEADMQDIVNDEAEQAAEARHTEFSSLNDD